MDDIDDIQFWVVGLLGFAILGVAFYGMRNGFSGVKFGIAARRRDDPQPSTNRRDAIRCGRRAVIAGGAVVAFLVLSVNVNILEVSDWRGLLIVEPALMLGIAALALARTRARPGITVVDLMGVVAWVALAIATPGVLSAFQLHLDRETQETITEAHERLAIADKIMDEGYKAAVQSKGSSSKNLRTREWARRGLSDARSGVQATNRLLVKTPNGPERQRLLDFRDDLTRQIGRYAEFVRGLGETP